MRAIEAYEPYEIRPLFNVVRAALSSPDRSKDPLTHEGIILLMDIIEDRVFVLEDLALSVQDREARTEDAVGPSKKARKGRA